MEQVTSPGGATVSYERVGSGPPLVLIHGALSDHNTCWFAVKGSLAEKFTLYAIDRRGRGETSATEGHSLEDESADAAVVIEAIGRPAFVLGHSYGAQVALGATALVSELVSKLILYEPPRGSTMSDEQLQTQDAYAAREDWDGFVSNVFLDIAQAPKAEVDALKAMPLWSLIVADAKASLGDFRALKRYDLDPRRFASLAMPVALLYGSESPSDKFATDLLAAQLPNATKVELTGQGHEAMVTDPAQFVAKVVGFLCG